MSKERIFPHSPSPDLSQYCSVKKSYRLRKLGELRELGELGEMDSGLSEQY
ncbi:MAG: hypothetical protein F6J92_26585 [Symploca sp. SIO1A3]|nr:hypothetical protein [Symploca sp. SIO1A3]